MIFFCFITFSDCYKIYVKKELLIIYTSQLLVFRALITLIEKTTVVKLVGNILFIVIFLFCADNIVDSPYNAADENPLAIKYQFQAVDQNVSSFL